MRNRISHAPIAQGEFSADRGSAAEHGELHYALFGDWGNVYVRWDGASEKSWWFHQFHSDPPWGELSEWLTAVEDGMRDYGLDSSDLAKTITANLREVWSVVR